MNFKKRGKKGQITLFIILGLVVLILIGVALFIINQSKKELPTEVYESDYDAKLAPIYNDVVFCMESLGEEAIKKIGANAGYLELIPETYTYNIPLAYANNALELFPGSEMVVPYWAYIESAPDCTACRFRQNIPPLTGQGNSIQNQIETYIEKNMVSCVNNFSSYTADLEIEYGTPVASVELREENVFVGLLWNITVTFSDGSVSDSLKGYSSTIDVRLKKMYELAIATLFQTEMMSNARVFEDFTKDIITFYSFGAEDAEIPPIAGPTVFEVAAPKFWLLSNVQSTLKYAIAETIPYMQVMGSKDSFIMNNNQNLVVQNTYSKYQNVIYYDDKFTPEVRVRFNYYELWPLYVSVGPSNGALIMPESTVVDVWLFKLATTKYRFNYDVTYPVLVTLEDDSAFGGEGFLFEYAFEVNLRNNEPYSNETIDLNQLVEPEEPETLGYEQRTVPVTINVIDGYTNMPLEGVAIKYTCTDTDYTVGVSKMNGGNAYIETKLAPCIGGAFSIIDNYYSENTVNMGVELDVPILLDYKVYGAKTIAVDIKKRLYSPTVTEVDTNGAIDRAWALNSGEGLTSSFELGEEYVLIMTEKREDGSNGVFAFLRSTDENKTVSLVPGKYSVQLISTLKLGPEYGRMNITIPARDIDADGETITINETVIRDTMYMGGLILDNTTIGYFEITPENLLTKNTLVFFLPSYDPDEIKYIEDMNVLSKIQEAPLTYPEYFTPVFE